MNVDTNRFFTWNEWRDFVEAAEKERTGVDPDNNTIISKALTMLAIQRQVPRPIRRELRKNFRAWGAPQKVYRVSPTGMVSGIWGGYNSIQKVEVDNVGVGHITDKNLPVKRKHTLVPACMWQHETEKDEALSQDPEYIPDERWVGPVTTAFPSNTKWTLQTESHYLGSYTVKKLTQLRTHHKMKIPPAQLAWESRLSELCVLYLCLSRTFCF